MRDPALILQRGGTVCRRHMDNTSIIRGGGEARSGWIIGENERACQVLQAVVVQRKGCITRADGV